MSTITLHKCEPEKTVSHEEEILDFILYNRALGNAVTSNKTFIS